MQFVPVNPRPMLQSLYVANFDPPCCCAVVSLSRQPQHYDWDGAANSFQQDGCADTIFPISRINEEVIIRLKWGQTEYKGRLISVDSYMNVQLNGTEEFINGKSTGTLGQVLIRYATDRVAGASNVKSYGNSLQ
jgi:small nuclear ribonucleoprotein (snRNP)-like protein